MAVDGDKQAKRTRSRRLLLVVLITVLLAGLALMAVYIYFPAAWPHSKPFLRPGKTYVFNEADGRQALDCFAVVKDRIVAHTFANDHGGFVRDRPLYIEATSFESLVRQVAKGMPSTDEDRVQGILDIAPEEYCPGILQEIVVDSSAVPYRAWQTVDDFILPPMSEFYRIIDGYKFNETPSDGKCVLGAAVSQSCFAFLLHDPGRAKLVYGHRNESKQMIDITSLLESGGLVHECYSRSIKCGLPSRDPEEDDQGPTKADLKDFNLLAHYSKIFYCGNSVIIYSWVCGSLVITDGINAKAYTTHTALLRGVTEMKEGTRIPESLVTGDDGYIYCGVIDDVSSSEAKNWQAELYRLPVNGLALGFPKKIGHVEIDSIVARLEVQGDRVFTESQRWSRDDERQTVVHCYRLIE
jgi:hypothetical protein